LLKNVIERLVEKMVSVDAEGGRALRIVIGITLLILLMGGGTFSLTQAEEAGSTIRI